jgi:ATP-dependent RNA helicase DHX36
VVEIYGGGLCNTRVDSEQLALLDLYNSIRTVTGGSVEPSKPIDVVKLSQQMLKAQVKDLADEGKLMLELVNASRPKTEYKKDSSGKGATKGGWIAQVSAMVDNGKRMEAEGRGAAKGNAEEAAYGSMVEGMASAIGTERHAVLRGLVQKSPGNSVAALRIPPLPDAAMDTIIAAMGTPADHDARMREWKSKETVATARRREGEGEESSARGGRREGGRGGDGIYVERRSPEVIAAVSDKFRAEEENRTAAASDPKSPGGIMQKIRDNLPIIQIREGLLEALKSSPVVVVSGGTGSGKSTQCPQYILEDAIANGLGPMTRIIVTQPRRIAAQGVAERVAAERMEACGNSVGYKVRLQGTKARREGGSIDFVTTGILLRTLVGDPTLAGVSHVMIDEVHERDINTDFLLVLLRSLLRQRPELRVVLMSATLDAQSFSDYFARPSILDAGGGAGASAALALPPAPLLSVPAATRFPVDMFYLEDLAGEGPGGGADMAARGGMGEKLSLALLEAQDEMLQHDLEQALWEQRASDALEEPEGDDDDEEDDEDGEDEDEDEDEDESGISMSDDGSKWEDLEVQIEGGGNPNKGRAPKGPKGQHERLNHRVKLLRRAVEMREGGGGVGPRSARMAAAKAKGRGGGGGASKGKKERDELMVELAADVARSIARAELAKGRTGSILIFFPGWKEIKDTMKVLEGLPKEESNALLILPLHSEVPATEQQRVFDKAPEGKIKIILSTNIAESSVTINDVLAVVDTGLVKQMDYNPEKTMSEMATVATSRASATQRTGRAGRVAAGVCYRLYSRAMYEAMAERPTPEIQRTELESTCLQTAKFKAPTTTVHDFLSEALDPPAEATVDSAMDRLKKLGAIVEVPAPTGAETTATRELLTHLGNILTELPLDPAVGRMLAVGSVMGCLDPVLTAAAVMSSRDPFLQPTYARDEAQAARKRFSDTSDVQAILRAYADWRYEIVKSSYYGAVQWARDNFLSAQGLDTITTLRRTLLGDLIKTGLVSPEDLEPGQRRGQDELSGNAVVNRHAQNEALITAVLATGFPSNLAARRTHAHFGVMRTEREDNAGIHPGSVVFHRAPPRGRDQAALADWVMYSEMVSSSQVFIRGVSAMNPEQVMLFGGSKLKKCEAVSTPPVSDGGKGPLLGADGLPTRSVAPSSRALAAANSPVAVIDDWIMVMSSCADTAELLEDVRGELDAALALKTMNPRQPLSPAFVSIIDAVAGTMTLVQKRNDLALNRFGPSQSSARGGGGGIRSGGAGRAGLNSRPGYGGGNGAAGAAPKKAGRLQRNAEGKFVRV